MRVICQLLDLCCEAMVREAQIEARLNREGNVKLTLKLASLLRNGYGRQDGSCDDHPIARTSGLKAPVNPKRTKLQLEPASSEPTAVEASRCDLASECCAVKDRLNDAAPEMIASTTDGHSPPHLCQSLQ